MEESRILFIGVGGLGKTMARTSMREVGMPFDDAVVIDRAFDATMGCTIKWIDTTNSTAVSLRRKIRQVLCASSYDQCWIVGGLGGEVASHYLPLVADIAKEINPTYNILVTCPFLFEGAGRQARAKEAIAHLEQEHTACLHVFYNEKEVPKDKTTREIFDTFWAWFREKISGMDTRLS